MTNSNKHTDNQEVRAESKTTPSFFDEMEDLETNETIGMSILDKAKPLAPEYGSED